MAHELLTGKQGRVAKDGAAYANTGEWAITPETDIHEKRTSATSQGPVRVAGIEKWSGAFDGHGGLPTIFPGDAFEFTGVVSGVGATDICTAIGNARCHEVQITVNYETGEPIMHNVAFQSNGTLTLANDTLIADAPLDTILPASSFVIPDGATIPVKSDDLSGAISYGDTFADVRTVTITLTTANPERITSSTAGVAKHDEGNIDAKVSLTVFEADPTLFLSIGDTKAYRFYVTASTYWDFEFLTVISMSDFSVDPANPDLIGVTYELGYTSIATIDTGGTPTDTQGTIAKPTGGDWYPEP